MQLVSERLSQRLPQRFSELADILHELPHHWDSGDPNDPLKGFAAWPILDLVPLRGMEHPGRALPLLARLTRVREDRSPLWLLLVKC